MNNIITIMVALLILAASGLITWQIIKYRNVTECQSVEIQTLQARLDDLRKQNVIDQKTLATIEANSKLYTKYEQEVKNTLNAIVG